MIMDAKETEKIKSRIESLPKGSIVVKRINGREYEYWQFYESGRQISKRIKGEELETISKQIEERKRLEQLLRTPLSNRNSDGEAMNAGGRDRIEFFTATRIGQELTEFAEPVRGFRKRDCFDSLKAYLDMPVTDRVFVLYGLRRTGKTTLIRQAILGMSEDKRNRTAFIQITPDNDLSQLNKDLKKLEQNGYKYVFIDEVTLLDDFIEGAALLSDIFASSGIRIVLSGTDSLGFVFAQSSSLYDRCIMLHTTFIPYREFERVLGIEGIDNYIKYGGTMSPGGVCYNEITVPFSSRERTNEYIDSAIAHNIQHSLKNYQDGGHFRHLAELYNAGELTNAINRVIEDMNHSFTVEVLSGTFKSHDLGVSKRNLRADRTEPSEALDEIELEEVTKRLMQLLEIKNREDLTVQIDEVHAEEIKEYLMLMNMVRQIDVASEKGERLTRNVIVQPGLRYSQVEALITSLMQDPSLLDIGIRERMRVTERIMEEVRGRMMEDIILLETDAAYPDRDVFVMQFAVGEIDMITFDPKTITCRLYEIKHSRERVPAQYRHLTDPDMLKTVQKQYGELEGRYVIYRGEETGENGIRYLNAEQYLKNLK